MMRKVSLVVGGCVVLLVVAKVLGLFSVHPAQKPPIPTTKQTTWTITIHNVGGSIQYDPVVNFTPDQSHGGCKYATATPTPPDPKNLAVCQNDIVQWQATTSSGPKSTLIVFMTDQFLTDQGSGNSLITFVGKDGKPTTPPGLVTAPDFNFHEWYVVLIDKQNPDGSVHDDPRIKTGG
jgi:hypothetical protein